MTANRFDETFILKNEGFFLVELCHRPSGSATLTIGNHDIDFTVGEKPELSVGLKSSGRRYARTPCEWSLASDKKPTLTVKLSAVAETVEDATVEDETVEDESVEDETVENNPIRIDGEEAVLHYCDDRYLLSEDTAKRVAALLGDLLKILEPQCE